MENTGPGELLTKQERLALKRLTRRGWDFLFDLRHWKCICAIARKRSISPTDVVFSILEKVFVVDLGMITAEDDTVDRSLRHIHTQLRRLRLRPYHLRKLLKSRGEDILLIAQLFPRELREKDHKLCSEDFVTRLREQLGLRIDQSPTLEYRTRSRAEEARSKETSEKARIETLVKKLKGRRNNDDSG